MSALIRNPQEQEICDRFQVSHLAGKLLAASGLSDDQIRELLDQDAALSTSRAECVQACARRIQKARENHEKVFIGGDYDADGITATAILKDTLDQLGIENGYYIPDRFREGYGLKPETVAAAAEKGYSLIITVDNGVSAFAAAEKALSLGLDIIITDHHEIGTPVTASLLVHPSLMEPQYAFLSGAGVALQISRTLLGEVKAHTGLAAVAAIADVMPLWRETRRIVKNGMACLRQNAVPAVTAMMAPGSAVNPTTLSFQVIPKLNSVGRMSDLSNVNTLVRYLLLKDERAIAAYTLQLNQVNDARKTLSGGMARQAEALLSDDPFEILFDPGFHEGICGLVAGRIASSTHKPTLVMAENGDLIKGSGRSVPGFNLYGFFQQDFDDLLQGFGGHEMAVGISVEKQDFEAFSARVQQKMAASGYSYEPPQDTAIEIDPALMTMPEISDLQNLEPLPKELGKPLFAIRSPLVMNRFESPKVLKYTCRNAQGSYEAVLYRRLNLEEPEAPALIYGTLSINRWRNQIIPQMEIQGLE